MIELDKTDPCPNCEHPLGEHSVDLGCHHGWGPYVNGIARNEGCHCPLSIALQHDPPREKDIEL